MGIQPPGLEPLFFADTTTDLARLAWFPASLSGAAEHELGLQNRFGGLPQPLLELSEFSECFFDPLWGHFGVETGPKRAKNRRKSRGTNIF